MPRLIMRLADSEAGLRPMVEAVTPAADRTAGAGRTRRRLAVAASVAALAGGRDGGRRATADAGRLFDRAGRNAHRLRSAVRISW